MSAKKIWLVKIVISLLIIMAVSSHGTAQERNIENEVWDILNSHSAYTAEELAALGKPAVPILIDIVEKRSWKYWGAVVTALGMIGDERATPLILRLMAEEAEEGEKKILRIGFLEALGQIGDPRAESQVLKIFEDEKQWKYINLLAAVTLLKVGGAESTEKVKAFTENLHNLWERRLFKHDQEARAELEEIGYSNNEIVGDHLPDLYLGLRDVNLLAGALRCRWLGKTGDTKYNQACQILAEIGSPETIEVLFQVAESDEAMIPYLHPDEPESWPKRFQEVPPATRIAAIEALLTIPEVDINRVTRAFEDIPVEDLRIIPLTVKLKPDKWNLKWKKAKGREDNDDDDKKKGKINCYLGNIPGGYSVRDIDVWTILLNGKVSPSKKGKKGRIHAKIKKHHKGFIGEVLEVKFDKFEAIKSIGSIWPGKECTITITGRLSDDKHFRESCRVNISKLKMMKKGKKIKASSH